MYSAFREAIEMSDGFQPVALVGVTAAHSSIQRNLLRLLFDRLRGQRFQGNLAMPEVGISIPLGEVHEGVEFPPDARLESG